MKAFQFLLVFCLLLSIFCKTARQVLACTISNLSDGECEDIYRFLLNSKTNGYLTLLTFDYNRIKGVMDNCL